MTRTYGVPRPDRVAYLDQAAATAPARAYKARLLTELELRSGHTVLDVGCGPGTDLAAMAAAVAPGGRVIGVDHADDMVREARQRLAGTPGVEVREGDAHDLPLDTSSVDRARVDRVLMHVTDPAEVLAELRRVVRPGGLVGLAEPDWDTLVVDPGDPETVRAFNRFVTGNQVRNATIGRQLARLGAAAGFTVRDVTGTAPVFRDLPVADQVLGLSRNAERAVRAGYLDRRAADRWIAALTEGPLLATFTVFTVVLERPS
ncbi:methyltransferase domain-containing protein [Streptantibioticus ferralitis]|uniref:Methyltransferase domain-containing protein n=1 Tax=Streptantibioticus ferralitis TaxID=236510 RepID=A0ABT5YTB5_9ACTN|nr:methyltransferase domain-containing protein [Streptantibioticus ferralitis]MDF2254750.1 methyltransferase domain-containing protein [Streptantibioticus ferralitis]